LCNNSTIIYKPKTKGQKEILNEKRILEQYSIHPNNFAMARAIDGDKSDNIDGVKGVGLKTLVKYIPELSGSETIDLDNIFQICESRLEKSKIFSSILKEKNKVELNYGLMQLYSPNISYDSCKQIRESIKNFEPFFNHTEFMKMLTRDGLVNFNWETMFQKFRSLSSVK
jgi:DNA polymerase-1